MDRLIITLTSLVILSVIFLIIPDPNTSGLVIAKSESSDGSSGSSTYHMLAVVKKRPTTTETFEDVSITLMTHGGIVPASTTEKTTTSLSTNQQQQQQQQQQSIPDRTCAFNPDGLAKCKPDSQDNCPAGFSLNESGKCFFSGKCPPGSTRRDNDESGKCFKTNT